MSGQIYSMIGMSTQLYLRADGQGSVEKPNPEFLNSKTSSGSRSIASSADFFHQCLERKRFLLEAEYFYFHPFYPIHRHIFLDLDHESFELQYEIGVKVEIEQLTKGSYYARKENAREGKAS